MVTRVALPLTLLVCLCVSEGKEAAQFESIQDLQDEQWDPHHHHHRAIEKDTTKTPPSPAHHHEAAHFESIHEIQDEAFEGKPIPNHHHHHHRRKEHHHRRQSKLQVESSSAEWLRSEDGSASQPVSPAPISPTTAGSKQDEHGSVYGYYPYWKGDDYMGIDLSMYTTVAYFKVEAQVDGTLNGTRTNWPNPEFVDYAHQSGCKVHVCVTLFDLDEEGQKKLLNTASTRVTLAKNIVKMVKDSRIEGVSIDMENLPKAVGHGYISFLKELHKQLGDKLPDAVLSVAVAMVDHSGAYPMADILSHSDQVFLMGYDEHWVKSDTAGPLASIDWVISSVKAWKGAGRGSSGADDGSGSDVGSKLVLGTGFYGYDWPTDNSSYPSSAKGPGKSKTYKEIVPMIEANGGTSGENDTFLARFDEDTKSPYIAYQTEGDEWHQLWYEDPASLKAKCHVITSEKLGGFGVWAIGSDIGNTLIQTLRLACHSGGGGGGGSDGGGSSGGSPVVDKVLWKNNGKHHQVATSTGGVSKLADVSEDTVDVDKPAATPSTAVDVEAGVVKGPKVKGRDGENSNSTPNHGGKLVKEDAGERSRGSSKSHAHRRHLRRVKHSRWMGGRYS